MINESPVLRPKDRAKTGLAKISGGALQVGMPDTGFVSISTSALTVNEVRYIPFRVRYAITVTAMYFEVTAAPAGAANVRLGIYATDTDMQPTGAPLANDGIAVAGAFTGLKAVTGLTAVLAPGAYVIAVNCDVTMTLRPFLAGAPFLSVGLGASAISKRMSVAQTYGSFPSPGTLWTTLNAANNGLEHVVLLQWTE